MCSVLVQNAHRVVYPLCRYVLLVNSSRTYIYGDETIAMRKAGEGVAYVACLCAGKLQHTTVARRQGRFSQKKRLTSSPTIRKMC